MEFKKDEDYRQIENILSNIKDFRESVFHPIGQMPLNKLNETASENLVSFIRQHSLIENFHYYYSSSGGGLQPVHYVRLSAKGYEVLLTDGGLKAYLSKKEEISGLELELKKEQLNTLRRKWYISIVISILSLITAALALGVNYNSKKEKQNPAGVQQEYSH